MPYYPPGIESRALYRVDVQNIFGLTDDIVKESLSVRNPRQVVQEQEFNGNITRGQITVTQSTARERWGTDLRVTTRSPWRTHLRILLGWLLFRICRSEQQLELPITADPTNMDENGQTHITNTAYCNDLNNISFIDLSSVPNAVFLSPLLIPGITSQTTWT